MRIVNKAFPSKFPRVPRSPFGAVFYAFFGYFWRMKNADFVDRLSLAEMGENRCGTVAQIEGDSRFISRIVSIGLTPGSAFTLLKNDGRSPVLVFCRDTVIAVNHKESSQIFVKVEL
jgi:ferrous iron transport protein A